MPSRLDAATIAAEQAHDTELPQLLAARLLNLQHYLIDGCSVACNIHGRVVRPYLPVNLRRTAFDIAHGLAHPSVRATVRAVADKFVWPGIREEVTDWTRSCVACQRAKVNRAALNSFNEPDELFHHAHLDIITLPQVGNFRYCLTIIDRFTRWPIAVPLADIMADTVAKAFVAAWVSDRSCPLTITTDQGTQFESALFTALAQMLGLQRVHTTPYHPQANGMVERMHRTLKAALMCISHMSWPDALPTVLLGLRAGFKEDLNASPWEMVYGTAPRLPGDFFVPAATPANPITFVEKLRALMEDIRPVPASSHSGRQPFTLKDLDTCSHVFMKVSSVRPPLTPPYSGPHEVVRRISQKVFVVKVKNAEKTVSTDTLKPAYLETAEAQNRQPPIQPRPETLPRPCTSSQRSQPPQELPPMQPEHPSLQPSVQDCITSPPPARHRQQPHVAADPGTAVPTPPRRSERIQNILKKKKKKKVSFRPSLIT